MSFSGYSLYCFHNLIHHLNKYTNRTHTSKRLIVITYTPTLLRIFRAQASLGITLRGCSGTAALQELRVAGNDPICCPSWREDLYLLSLQSPREKEASMDEMNCWVCRQWKHDFVSMMITLNMSLLQIPISGFELEKVPQFSTPGKEWNVARVPSPVLVPVLRQA